jgi:hypothetical protein
MAYSNLENQIAVLSSTQGEICCTPMVCADSLAKSGGGGNEKNRKDKAFP